MIWKVKAVEAYPVEGDETEYEFQAPTTSMHGGIQILDFTPEMEMPVDDDRGGIIWEKQSAIVLYAYPDRVSSEELTGCGSSSENELTNR